MYLYLVSYDLNKPIQEYKELYKELKKGENWWHYLDSTWLVITDESIEVLYNRIKSRMDSNDHILIFEVTNQAYHGWLKKGAWKWIKRHIGGN